MKRMQRLDYEDLVYVNFLTALFVNHSNITNVYCFVIEISSSICLDMKVCVRLMIFEYHGLCHDLPHVRIVEFQRQIEDELFCS